MANFNLTTEFPTLSVKELVLRFGSFIAVNHLSFDVFPGEIFGFLGPNGSGKSSTLGAIAGHLRPRSGQIRLKGIDPVEKPRDYRRHLGLVPQDFAFFEELPANANLSFFGKLYGLRGAMLKQRLEEVFDLIGLSQNDIRPVRTYSGGMARRLNLGCALMHKPALLLLDEPTVGLDLFSRDTIFTTLRTLRSHGTAIIFTTHHMEEVELLCDRIGIIDGGRLIAMGTLSELMGEAMVPPNGMRGPRMRIDQAHGTQPAHSLQTLFRRLTARSGSEAC